jgi:pilus assembly protein CpaB
VLLRVAFFILMALALVGFGMVAWVTLRPPPQPQVVQIAPVPPVVLVAPAPAPVPPPQVKVLVAAHPIPAGSMLKPEDIVARAIPAGDHPGMIAADSLDAVRSLAGSMAKHAMALNEPIRDEDVIRPTDHGFMAAALQAGMRAVTIGVDATSGSAGLVWPGDRVDLTLTQTLTDPALPPGRRVSAETILTNARVIAIDQQLVQGNAPSGGDTQNRTVTLEVKPADVQRVSVAMRLGRLSLSVRAVSPDEAASAVSGSPGSVAAPQGGSVYARDVSAALGGEAPAPAPQQRVIHVFHGSADPKEFKY